MSQSSGPQQLRNQPSVGESNKQLRKRVEVVDSDEDANNAQMIMNCVYTLLFLVIGGIFCWQYWLA